MPASPTTSDPKTSPTLRIRTMAGDLEALKKGGLPAYTPVTVEPASKPAPTPPLPAGANAAPGPKNAKPSFPNIDRPVSKPIEKPAQPERNWPPTYPSRHPFNAPINRPIIPPQKQPIQPYSQAAPPLDLPTTDAPPPRPPSPRPLTPPPPPLPPLPPLSTGQAGLPTPPTTRPAGTLPGRPPPPPPLPRPISPRPTPPAALPRTENGGSKKKMVIMAILGALILTFVVGEIWWFFLRGKESPQPAQELLPPPQELRPLLPPAVEETPILEPEGLFVSLLRYDHVQMLDLAELTALSSDVVASDELVKISLADTSAAAAGGPSLAEVAAELKIKIPTAVIQNLTGEFEIFGFGGNTFDQNECARAGLSSPACFGPRLGFALRTSDLAGIASALRAWEKTMALDLKPIILAKTGSPASAVFQTGTYRGQTIRYQNLPVNTITIEYALIDDALIITTSKSAMLKAIDSLAQTGE